MAKKMNEDTTRVSIKDIARAVGKHHTTVSRALRGDPSISVETKRLIATAAQKLGYVPDPHLAEVMKIVRKRSKKIDDTLALAVPPAAPESDTSGALKAILDGAEAAIASAGYKVDHMVNDEHGMSLGRIQQIAIARGYRGMMILPFIQDPTSFTPEPGFPCVAVGFDSLPDVNIRRVCFDAFGSMRIALSHLAVELGHREILVILTDRVFACARERYEAACKQQIEADVVVTLLSDSETLGEEWPVVVRKVNKASANAILCDDVDFLRSLEKQVSGKEFFLIGNLQDGMQGIQLPFRKVGEGAAELLISMIGSPRIHEEPDLQCLLLRGNWAKL